MVSPKKKGKRPTNRKQFVAWLNYELTQRGANLPEKNDYRALRIAVEQYLMGRQ